MKECYLYDKLKNNLVKCKACSHKCTILPSKTGICGVRKNLNGILYSLVYGKAVGLHIDPIEKKPLFHFLPGKKVLSFGTAGCNFRCSFCQNFDMSQSPREKGEKGIFGEDGAPELIVDAAVSKKVPMIAYTYNEPAIFIEYAFDTAKLAHSRGIKNIYVTNGYETKEALEMMKPYIDAMNIDLKSFSEDFYVKLCGGKLKPVLETIKRAHKMNFWIEITTLIIPEKNDSKEELTKIAEFIASVDKNIPWHISRFHPMYKMQDVAVTSEEKLNEAYGIGKKAGLNFVYVGNIMIEGKENTYCPKCNETVIERARYSLGKVNLKGNKCGKCGEKIFGVF